MEINSQIGFSKKKKTRYICQVIEKSILKIIEENNKIKSEHGNEAKNWFSLFLLCRKMISHSEFRCFKIFTIISKFNVAFLRKRNVHNVCHLRAIISNRSWNLEKCICMQTCEQHSLQSIQSTNIHIRFNWKIIIWKFSVKIGIWPSAFVVKWWFRIVDCKNYLNRLCLCSATEWNSFTN